MQHRLRIPVFPSLSFSPSLSLSPPPPSSLLPLILIFSPIAITPIANPSFIQAVPFFCHPPHRQVGRKGVCCHLPPSFTQVAARGPPPSRQVGRKGVCCHCGGAHCHNHEYRMDVTTKTRDSVRRHGDPQSCGCCARAATLKGSWPGRPRLHACKISGSGCGKMMLFPIWRPGRKVECTGHYVLASMGDREPCTQNLCEQPVVCVKQGDG